MALDRGEVITFLREAFHKTATYDYALKHAASEEDIRACVYSYMRYAIANDLRWRVFLSPSIHLSKEKIVKPDMVFVRAKEKPHLEISVEIVVEIKYWTKAPKEIEHDMKKLEEISGFYYDKVVDHRPEILFFAILGSKIDFKKNFQRFREDSVVLYEHDKVFKEPWNEEEKRDEYMKYFRDWYYEKGSASSI